MNESTPIETTTDFPGLRVAVRLGAALLVGLAITLALVLRDNARRSALEGIVESTAVGDTHYLPIPEPLPPEPFPAVAHLHGQPLIPSGYKRHEKREADLQPVAKDAATGLTIYQAPIKAKDAREPPTYFLKTGPGEFLKVRPAGSRK